MLRDYFTTKQVENIPFTAQAASITLTFTFLLSRVVPLVSPRDQFKLYVRGFTTFTLKRK